ncbi:MAG: M48 family metalloprotease [Devosiaceae bacterium]|nr:M48 family metalloprotease [Devosiaceae bacterium]
MSEMVRRKMVKYGNVSKFIRTLIFGAGLLALSACSSLFGTSGINVSQTGMGQVQAVPSGTSPTDAVIGRREHPIIVASYGGEYTHRRTEIMLEQIVSKLLVAARQPETAFKITILNSPQVNAFALPGGFIYVTRGILALANDTSELAAVLAHEIAHVTLRHARARTNRVATSRLVDRVITGVLGGNAQTDQGVARSQLSLAAFSQGQELSADEEGVRIAGRAGYDPHAASRFLAAMNRYASFGISSETQGDDFLSTHPSTPNRIQRAEEAARGFDAPGTISVDRVSYMAAIDGILFGDSPEQGAVVGQRFIHPDLKFTFAVPERFELQNSRDAVVGVAGDGEAVRFDSAEVPRSMDLSDYLKSGWIAGLDNNSVKLERHNGVEMASGIATTDQWAFRVTALRFQGKVYRFIFAARNQSSTFKAGAASTIASFRQTKAADLRAIQLVKIGLVVARPGDNADTLGAKMQNIPNGKALFLLLNDLLSGDPVVAGQSYKIVIVG